MSRQCWWHVYWPVWTLRAVKLPELLIGVEPSPTPRRAAPRPPNSVGTCDAAGICSKAVARPVTPHVIIEWVDGAYELAGQSIISNGVTTYWLVSYGSYAHPILYGFPSGAVAVANGVPVAVTASGVVHGMLLLFTGLNSTFFAVGIGCVGHEFTPGALLVGTFVSLTGRSGLPVTRSRTNVMPYLLTNATAGRWTDLTVVFVTVLNLPLTLTRALAVVLTLNVPLKSTPLFGRSESHRSWCAVW